MKRIVIVGASLAGTRAAQRLRSEGFNGELIIVGDEEHMPYDRPPLSKQFLTGDWQEDDLSLLQADEIEELNAEWRLRTKAIALDPDHRTLSLESGEALNFDGLIIATGARARQLPGVDLGSRKIHVLRSLGDACGLATDLRTKGGSLCIIGGGFLGSEMASSARKLGLRVTMIERESAPMAAILGEEVGNVFAELQRNSGVILRTNETVLDIQTEAPGESEPLRVITDGSELDSIDHIVLSIGAVANTEWLAGSGLNVNNGVVCDDRLFVTDEIVVAGDVARIRETDGTLRRRVEHWTNAIQLGELAASNMLGGRASATSFNSLPYVWSDQFDSRIEIIGSPQGTDSVELLASTENRYLYCYRRDGRPSAIVAINAGSWILGIRRSLNDTSAITESMLEELKTACEPSFALHA